MARASFELSQTISGVSEGRSRSGSVSMRTLAELRAISLSRMLWMEWEQPEPML